MANTTDRPAPPRDTPVRIAHGPADDLTIPRVPVYSAHDDLLLLRRPSTTRERITMAAIVGVGAAFWVALVALAIDKGLSANAPPDVACIQPRGHA